MILHIASDEKFIDSGFRVFEEVSPNENKLIIVTSENKVNFVKKSPFNTFTPNELQAKEFTRYLEGVTAVVFHSLSFLNVRVPPHVKTLWIGFGFDYYDLIYKNPNALFLPSTQKLKESLIQEYRVNKVKAAFKKIPFLHSLNKRLKGHITKLEFINQIDYFAPVLNSEYDLVVNSISNFNPEFIDWNYGTLEDDLLKGFEEKTVTGSNILVGNSATYANNHLEAFDLLGLLDTTNKDIICPLSYGVDAYRDEICSVGNKLFNSQFNALTGFMPIDEYINILSSCSIVIMNHIRQQALGNIIIMLYLGAKVFLRKENPVYIFFKNEGAKIYSIEALEKNSELINDKITEEDIALNKSILRKYWSRNVIQEKTKVLINKITS